MDEESDLLTGDGQPLRELTRRRLMIWMSAFVILAATAGFIFGPARFGLGIFFGGILAFANFLWLDRSTKRIFENAVSGIMPGLLAVRYILRYFALGLILWLIYRTDAFPVVAVIVGLSAFAMAVVAEGISSIFSRK